MDQYSILRGQPEVNNQGFFLITFCLYLGGKVWYDGTSVPRAGQFRAALLRAMVAT